VFFGDPVSAAGYESALERLAKLGADIVKVDIEPFYEAARLLYDGPWVAERYIAARSLIASAPEAMHPVTRQIILSGARPTAVDTFAALYKLEDLRRVRDHIFRDIDALALPTMPTAYTIEQVLADPIQLNSRLGTYTNFVNLLELCGLALPSSMRPDGTPFGVTLLAPGGRDAFLASIGRVFHADTGLSLGATGAAQPTPEPCPSSMAEREIALGVVGAHLSGMPLNGELLALGAHRLETTTTAKEYRLFALSGMKPPKPGLLRVAAGTGAAIELEIWAMPLEAFGRFVAAVPQPMSIGSITLADDRTVKGFLVEAEATVDARDISEFGGWRAYVAQSKVAASS
jgi:allophanate hydrolase